MSHFRWIKSEGGAHERDSDYECLNRGDLKIVFPCGEQEVNLVWSEHLLGDNFIFPAAQILCETVSVQLLRTEVLQPLQRLVLICPGTENRQLCNPAPCFYPTSSRPHPSQQAAVVLVLMLLMLPTWNVMLHHSENLGRKWQEFGNSFFILKPKKNLLKGMSPNSHRD